jgi:CBS domain-containing protein
MVSPRNGMPAPIRLRAIERRLTSLALEPAPRSVVHCPETDRARPISDCRRCGACAGLVQDSTGGLVAVDCLQPAGEPVTRRPVEPDVVWDTPSDPPRPIIACTTVRDAMRETLVAIRREATLETLRRVMVQHGVGGLPVTNGQRLPVGFVSRSDLVRAEVEGGLEGRTVDDIMVPVAVLLGADMPLPEAAALLASEGLHRGPVVDPHGVLVGMLSSVDIMRCVAERAGYSPPRRR